MKIKSTRKRTRIAPALIALLVLVLAANAGRILVVDAPERSHTIVVLAGETDRRPTKALELLRQGYARRIVIDVPAGVKIYQFTQTELAQQYMRGLPEAAAVRICPIVGLSTRDEAHDVKGCLTQEDGNRILLVTSDFHTRRSLSIFRHEIGGKSFAVAAAHDETQFGSRWWAHRQWAKTCFEEWLRLAWWMTVDRWR